MKTLRKTGAFLGLVALAWIVSLTAEAQQEIAPPRVDAPVPFGAASRNIAGATPDLSRQSIEQLIAYITDLKKQRIELEQLEAKAVTVLKQRLKEANEKAAQFEGRRPETKTETKIEFYEKKK